MGEIAVMNCPKCNDITLRKRGYGSPYNCNKCGGMWLEFAEIPGFFETIRLEERQEVSANLNDDKASFCPAGHSLLTRAKVEDTGNPFYLEKCSTCGGIWFDNDEWQRIINNKLVDNINDIWCSSWQAQQRNQKSRTTYLEANKKVFGEKIFDRVIELSILLKEHPEKGRAIALLQEELR